MMNQTEIEAIKKLIENGFSLDLISFELDIPMEELDKIKNQQTSTSKDVFADKEKQQLYSKLNKMKQKYSNLLSGGNTTRNLPSEKSSPKNMDVINSKISEIKSTMENIEEKQKKERANDLRSIFKLVKELNKCPLNFEQADYLNSLLTSQELEHLVITSGTIEDRLYPTLNNSRTLITRKLIAAIDVAKDSTNDINELKLFKSKITPEIERTNSLASNLLKNKITCKIAQLKQSKKSDEGTSNFSEAVSKIALALSNGTLDIEEAKKTVSEEARKVVQSRTKNIFSLTEEQEEKRILFQIRNEIIENVDKYDVQNPELLMSQMQELFDITSEQSLRIVVESLINRKNLKMATLLCDKFYCDDKTSSMSDTIRNLTIKIKSAEISNIVLDILNGTGDVKDVEDQVNYLQLLESGINSKKIDLKTISLGKSQDGLKSITLADIWENEPQKSK